MTLGSCDYLEELKVTNKTKEKTVDVKYKRGEETKIDIDASKKN